MTELTKLGKYTIQSVLGQGAMGVVYKGFDPHIERTVAIKTIRKDALSSKDMEPLLTRFKREAQAAGRLTHPAIVTVYEYGDEGDSAFIAMEFVQGRELKDFLDNNERFPLDTINSIIIQLLDALAYSHNQGVVHRDIKPGNIIVLDDGKIKVTDFGIARIESSTLTQLGDLIGTPSYMSPEQFSGQQVDKRSDLFSAGVILYHLLTGEKPFPGNSMTTIMHRVINTNPPLVSDLNFQVPSVFDALVLKSLAKKPADRFQSAEQFAAELGKAHASGKKSASTSTAGNDATVIIGTDDDRTIDLPSAEIPTVIHGNVGEDLEHKFDKIVGLLEARGIITHEAENNAYQRARIIVLSILFLIFMSIGSYTVWLIYSEDLTYYELKQIAIEKTEDIKTLISGKKGEIVEVTMSGKKKASKEFQREPAIEEEEREAIKKSPSPPKPPQTSVIAEPTKPSPTPN